MCYRTEQVDQVTDDLTTSYVGLTNVSTRFTRINIKIPCFNSNLKHDVAGSE